MLGAQALRTKQAFQKAEQKEKEKRHRQRLQSIQIEREKMHQAAREEMEGLTNETSLLHVRDSSNPPRRDSDGKSPSHSDVGPDRDPPTPRHRHSVHNVHMLNPQSHKRGSSIRLPEPPGPQRSTSSDYCRIEKKESGNRFMRCRILIFDL